MNDPQLENAIEKVTMNLVKELEHGEEVELNEKYSLYNYFDMEYYTIREIETNDEVLVVQFDDAGNFVFTEI